VDKRGKPAQKPSIKGKEKKGVQDKKNLKGLDSAEKQ